MLIQMFCTRTPDQRAVCNVSAWTVDTGTIYLARVCWDPHGPLSAPEAAYEALRRVARPVGALLASGEDPVALGRYPRF